VTSTPLVGPPRAVAPAPSRPRARLDGVTGTAGAADGPGLVGPAATSAAGALEIVGVRKSFGPTEVLRGVSIAIRPGAVCALLGPSGSGKTTLLRLVAGLERLDAGSIALDGRTLSGPGVEVRPERRRIGMVFQDWALFPHLTVAENVAFGLGRSGRRSPRTREALAMVGLEAFADRQPGTLSGGQQQRVALARALAPEPEVLLLDEPFSNLDVALRVRVRTEVARLLADAGITAVFVTHDQEEAFVLGTQVAVMRDGQIVQVATPAELYSRPADAWVATFVGDANLLPATIGGGVATSALGAVPVVDAPHGATRLLVRPEHVHLTPGDQGTVELVEFYGHDCMVIARLDDGQQLRARVPTTALQRHDRIAASYAGPPTTAFPVVAEGAPTPAGAAAP
jgi:iron(III) transport system ATP-binding protein